MQPIPVPSTHKAWPLSMGVIVVGCGPEAVLRGPDGAAEQATRRLARRLALPHRPISDARSPHQQLRQLQGLPGGWLASLPLDPGQALPDGSTWAEALGAWHQPTLLIIVAQQHTSGVAAATTALLGRWRVPLLGLVQWGGPWHGELRRRDGLPWLGRWDEGAGEADAASSLAELVVRRWALLDLPWSAPASSDLQRREPEA